MKMDQDDFAQEARIMMLRAVHKYDENHAVSFAGYYQRCLKNLAVECLRREHRQRLIPHELVVRGEKAELALLSASVDLVRTASFCMKSRRNISTTFPL